MRLPLPVATYALTSAQTASKRLINCYAEQQDPQDAKSPVLIRRTPGIRSFATAGRAGRGLFVFRDALYAVSGTKLYRVTDLGVATEIGTISGTGPVVMATNGSALVIVAEPSAYYYDGTTFGQITDTDFTSRGASTVRFVDNYMIFAEPNTGRTFTSDLGSVVNFNALAFATAEGAPDNVVGLEVDHRDVAKFGAQTIELWYNAGTTPYPLARLPSGGFIELGCAAPKSIAKADNSFLWFANDRTVRRLEGSTPVRLSTHAIEEQIAKFETIDDAIAFSYTMAGHVFYVLTFPTEGRTFVYDITAQSWHERESYGVGRWRPISYADCYGKHFVQDYASGKIGELTADVYAEWTEPLVMAWTYPKVYADGALAKFARFEVHAEVGVGLVSGQGSDPRISLEVSDNGKQFRFMADRSIGAMGEYNKRVYWHRLGSARNRVFRCSVSDPVPVTVSDTQIEVDGGRL
jgi:hypothetical protein